MFQHQTWSAHHPTLTTKQAKHTISTYTKGSINDFDRIPHHTTFELNKQNLQSPSSPLPLTRTAFNSPALLYNAVDNYSLPTTQRLGLMLKLHQATCGRIVLNSHLCYELQQQELSFASQRQLPLLEFTQQQQDLDGQMLFEGSMGMGSEPDDAMELGEANQTPIDITSPPQLNLPTLNETFTNHTKPQSLQPAQVRQLTPPHETSPNTNNQSESSSLKKQTQIKPERPSLVSVDPRRDIEETDGKYSNTESEDEEAFSFQPQQPPHQLSQANNSSNNPPTSTPTPSLFRPPQEQPMTDTKQGQQNQQRVGDDKGDSPSPSPQQPQFSHVFDAMEEFRSRLQQPSQVSPKSTSKQDSPQPQSPSKSIAFTLPTSDISSIPNTNFFKQYNPTAIDNPYLMSQTISKHFNSAALFKDFRMGLDIHLNQRFHAPLLKQLGMDSRTAVIPFQTMLNIAIQNLSHITPPPTYISLPLDYLMMMRNVADPETYPPPLSQRDYQTIFQVQPYQEYPSIRADGNWPSGTTPHYYHTNRRQARNSTTTTTTTSTSTSRQEQNLEDLSQYHSMVTPLATPYKPQTRWFSTPAKPLSWKDSVSPLTNWIIDTTTKQHHELSRCLRTSVRNERYHGFFALRRQYALVLFAFANNINPSDIRLGRVEFTREITAVRQSLNPITMDSVLCPDQIGHRETSQGITPPHLSQLYTAFGPSIWTTHTAHKTTPDVAPFSPVPTPSLKRDGNSNWKRKRQTSKFPSPFQHSHDIFHNLSSLYPSLSGYHPTYALPTPHSAKFPLDQPLAHAIASVLTKPSANSIAAELAKQSHQPHPHNIQYESILLLSSPTTTPTTRGATTDPFPKLIQPQIKPPRDSIPSNLAHWLFDNPSRSDQVATLNNYLKHTPKVTYSPLYPQYPCDLPEFNNIGRCHSILLASSKQYSHLDQLPRTRTLIDDYRRSPLKLLHQIQYTKSSLLQDPFPGGVSSVWRQFWWQDLPQIRLRRRTLASLIASSLYKHGPQHCTVHYAKINTPSVNREDEEDGHTQYSTPVPIIGNDTEPLQSPSHSHMTTLSKLSQKAGNAAQKWQSSTPVSVRHWRGFVDHDGYHLDAIVETELIPPQPPHPCQFTPAQLKKTRKSLRRTHSHINIYRGDTIRQHHIRGVFSLWGENNWIFRGDPQLLLPIEPFTQDPVGQMLTTLLG